MIQIIPAKSEDLPVLLQIYESARKYMRRTGNLTQWQGGFPPEKLLLSDIEKEQLFVMKSNARIVGVFALITGPDPTYSYIEDGSWLSDEEYATIHRIASDGTESGILASISFVPNPLCTNPGEPHLGQDDGTFL